MILTGTYSELTEQSGSAASTNPLIRTQFHFTPASEKEQLFLPLDIRQIPAVKSRCDALDKCVAPERLARPFADHITGTVLIADGGMNVSPVIGGV